MIKPASRITLFCACLLGVSHLQAHDFWLEPNTFLPEKSDEVAVTLHFGIGFKGDTLPYINELFEDFSISDKNGRLDVQSIQGNDPAATIRASAGAQLLGYQSTPQFVELDAAKFRKYVAEEGLEYILAERERLGENDAPAPENFTRHAKALIQTGVASDEIYRQALGYTLELIPLTDPYRTQTGELLEFELLYNGNPVGGLQLQALSKAFPEKVQKIRTDNEGRAAISVNSTGPWLVKAVMILPIAGRSQAPEGAQIAKWRSHWASFVFEIADN